MQNIEEKLRVKKESMLKENIINSMKKNKKYWFNYYGKDKKLFLESKLDRMRYYVNEKNVEGAIKILKKNINSLNMKKILFFLKKEQKKEFLNFHKKKLTHFENLKMIFISKSLIRYFSACGYKIN